MKPVNSFLYSLLFLATACNISNSSGQNSSDTGKIVQITPGKSDVTLTMPEGFTATVFADGLGKARHICVTASGYVYIKLDGTKNKGTIVRLKDTNGDGVADQELDFGTFKGTGIGVKNGYLYASSDQEVFRFKLNEDGTVANAAAPE